MLAVDVLGGLLLVAVLALVGIPIRRQLLRRHGGTVDVSLRLPRWRRGDGWTTGVGRYDGECLVWYRLISLSPRPRRAVCRRGLAVTGRRQPSATEAPSLMPGAVIVECRSEDARLDLAMSDAAYPGFLSWLEAAPSVESDRLV